MLRSLVAGALLALSTAGCAVVQPEEQMPAAAQAPTVELTKEQGGRFIAFVGPRSQHTEPFLGVSDTNYFTLRSWYDNKTGEAAHQVYVEDSYYGGPYSWNGAQDGDDKPFKFIPISRNEISCDDGCAYADEFAAALPEDYLRAHQHGFAVRFTAADGKALTANVPAEFVVAQLAAVDAVRSIAAKVAAAPPQPAATALADPAQSVSIAPPPAASAAASAPSPALPVGTVVPAPPPTK